MNRQRGREIDPDQVLIDSSNLPEYDRHQLEGRLEKPIPRGTLVGLSAVFLLIILTFLGQAMNLTILQGDEYLKKSENNALSPVPIFASRGAIFDRNGVQLVWNAPSDLSQSTSTAKFPEDAIPRRQYATTTGLAHVLGYVQYPSKDKNGFYYQNDFSGVVGVEKYYNDELTGVNGSRLVEVDARGNLVSESVVRPPKPGKTITLSIDSRVQSALYRNIKSIASEYKFDGGAGIIMDARTGEIIALTSYPEYSPQVMSDKTDKVAVKEALQNPDLPFLDRVVLGLYTPGSIVKPYVALGALNEKTIDPNKIIYTTGLIEVQNQYDPKLFNIFRDWKNLGPVDMRHAISKSSDVYFYTIGGGHKDQKGMGIANISKYFALFGLGEAIPKSFVTGPSGTISSPEWKRATFNEPWYLGNTYHSVIGQYGTQVTPAQTVRAVAAMGNNGILLVPTIIKGEGPNVESVIDIPKAYFDIVHEGMRLAVTEGTSVALNKPFVKIAAKSGTAELGISKANVNSWITGFWPYEEAKYAFAVMLEHGSVHNLIGAAAVMRHQLEWMNENTPEYFK